MSAQDRVREFIAAHLALGAGDQITVKHSPIDGRRTPLTVRDLVELLNQSDVAERLQRNIDAELARAFNQLTAMQVNDMWQVEAMPTGTILQAIEQPHIVYRKAANNTWHSTNWPGELEDDQVVVPARVLR